MSSTSSIPEADRLVHSVPVVYSRLYSSPKDGESLFLVDAAHFPRLYDQAGPEVAQLLQHTFTERLEGMKGVHISDFSYVLGNKQNPWNTCRFFGVGIKDESPEDVFKLLKDIPDDVVTTVCSFYPQFQKDALLWRMTYTVLEPLTLSKARELETRLDDASKEKSHILLI